MVSDYETNVKIKGLLGRAKEGEYLLLKVPEVI